jgi:diadenosine tetraphosphatase ApaH/serine/threonine PP2A family protein phosphatase
MSGGAQGVAKGRQPLYAGLRMWRVYSKVGNVDDNIHATAGAEDAKKGIVNEILAPPHHHSPNPSTANLLVIPYPSIDAGSFYPSSVPIRKPLQIAKEQVSKDELGWLRDLPITVDLDPITLSHASLNEPPEFNYIYETTEAEAHFAAQTTFISFNGHTHVPGIWEENPETLGVRSLKPGDKPVRLDPSKRYTVNVGSVGQPRDGDPRASYALYDYEQHLLVMRRVEYDIKKAQARYRKAGLPAHNASRLAKAE